MNSKLEQRLLIYAPLAAMCGLAGIWLGPAAAVWSFIQVLAVFELTNWLGAPGRQIQGGVTAS